MAYLARYAPGWSPEYIRAHCAADIELMVEEISSIVLREQKDGSK